MELLHLIMLAATHSNKLQDMILKIQIFLNGRVLALVGTHQHAPGI
jgi:hypothetical protein